MILVLIAYLVVNDLKEYIRDKLKSKEMFNVFDVVKLAFSVLISTNYELATKSFNLLNNDSHQYLCHHPAFNSFEILLYSELFAYISISHGEL